MNRRNFLKATSASFFMGLSNPSLAATTERKFIFVFNPGGWDTTRVFATEFSNPQIDMEATAEQQSIGNLSFVTHPDRPSVQSFFNTTYQDLLMINGMQVRSISHDICTMLAMTGSSSGRSPGWAAVLAEEAQQEYALPHLVLGGPSFPGAFGAKVARSGLNGQLDALLSADILQLNNGEESLQSLSSRSHRYLLDDYILQRARAEQSKATRGRKKILTQSLLQSQQAAVALQDYRYVMDFTGQTTQDKVDVAIDALRLGVSRCVTIDGPQGWDSHANNDQTQSTLFENLFASLLHLRNRLQTTTALSGNTLAEETVVVVLSEMGRTPQLNATFGKDHWPNTSMLMWGNGITGNRTIGAYDGGFLASPVDMASGELSDSGTVLSIESVGAGLLALGDVDPAQYIKDAEPLGIAQ